MYTRDHFSLPSVEAICDFAQAKSFGVIAASHNGDVYSSPLPFDLRRADDGSLFVAAHVARANEMTRSFAARPGATITVLGPDSYVPAEWFGTRSRIPTWIYCAVEISGRLEPSDEAQTRADVVVLIDRLQKRAVSDSTWTLDEMPADTVAGYLAAIWGFRLYDLRFKSCFRLNQRMGETDSLAESLRMTGAPALTELAALVLQPPTVGAA